VRVADACLTVEDAVLLAAVTRGLVAALTDDIRYHSKTQPSSTAQVEASLLATAHYGVAGGHATGDARQQTFESLRLRLLDKVGPTLDRFGDLDEVVGGLRRIADVGSGADRQRRMWSRATRREEFVRSLADAAIAPVPAG
jgi:carboxylate-amine ligase